MHWFHIWYNNFIYSLGISNFRCNIQIGFQLKAFAKQIISD